LRDTEPETGAPPRTFREVRIGSLRCPVVLPTRRDPRLQLACVIISLHILGQLKFDF
jgi:hypothetical protein